ncbi:MAG TPA: hypothetical protein VE869_04115 [Gemmatimonas sp.]|nr:hypothetical protein [Gemmatimonas sp.]
MSSRWTFFTPLLVALTAVCVVASDTELAAQERPRSESHRIGGVPRETAREIIALWNRPGTRRVRGDFVLPAGESVTGTVAVLGGQSQIAGTVIGQVVVINGDVRLASTARVDGDVTVVGGELEYNTDRPPVSGEVRAWSARVRYHEEADTLVLDDRDLFARFRPYDEDADGTSSDLLVTTAHTYNRVEGLPLLVGPRFSVRTGDTRFTTEVFGIFRTGDRLVWKRENLGHAVRAELRQGRRGGFLVGGRLFDEVEAVEQWQLTKGEVGLASFVFTRDYRDYWQRHGASGHVGLFARRGTEIRFGFSNERWTSRAARDVPSLIDNDVPWRLNALMDEGVMKLFTVTGSVDTRNDRDNPRTGWLLHGEFEHGSGELERVAPTTVGIRAQGLGDIQYSRAFLDLRRYNRLGPNAQLNLRVVAGGWLSGDPLPMQRRFSVTGVDALPGFDFRRVNDEADVGTCATGGEAGYIALGRPAQCERMVLLQAEWKGGFRVNLFGRDDDIGDRRYTTGRASADGNWVVFANSGRGWLLGDRGDLLEGDVRVATGRVPDVGTWRTDLGVGLDFGHLGVYVAQSVSESGLSPNVFVRLNRRF